MEIVHLQLQSTLALTQKFSIAPAVVVILPIFTMIQLLLLALLPVCISVREQSIAVKGRLLCGDQPAANVRVKLWEEDTGQLALPFTFDHRWEAEDFLEAGVVFWVVPTQGKHQFVAELTFEMLFVIKCLRIYEN
ncbi:hypothetical protein Y032_0010g968 [Ancylostoma ceylanicum]|uniref:Transthyretin-like family protein n=1 Tax=Ancylostoma ceylanicum TaxID=53326 RepID=A0A016VH83_9BILA|nr:hypothetical protein Y032_0010g968 [Ancylostoma ceylanicum]